MALNGPYVQGRQLFGGARQSGRRIAFVHDGFIMIRNAFADVPVQVVTAGQPLFFGPGDFELLRSPNCGPFIGSNDTEKILNPDNAGAGDRSNRRLVERHQLRTNRWRMDHASMQHAGKRKVLYIDVAAGAFIRNVRAQDRPADDRVGLRIFQRSIGIDLQIEPLSAGERANIRSRLRAQFHQRLARCSGRPPELDTSLRDTGAASGSAVVGRDCGVAFDNRNSIHRDVEFFGNHLAHRDP